MTSLRLEILKLKKNKFYHYESPILLKDVDIEKLLVSNKIYFGEKKAINTLFIGHVYNDHKVKQLHIMLPKTSTNVKNYDGQNKSMYFSVENGDLLEKCNIIWDKVSVEVAVTKLLIFVIKKFLRLTLIILV